MDIDSQFKHIVLMGNRIHVTDHFKKRYKERVSKGSTKVISFAKNAYRLGKDIDSLGKDAIRQIRGGKDGYGYVGKVYGGFVLWYFKNRAITVYPVSWLNNNRRIAKNG